RYQGKGRNHQQAGEEQAQATHDQRPFLEGAVGATRFMALTKDAPWSAGSGVEVRSATRNTADLARTFSLASSSLGRTRPSELSIGLGMSFSKIGRRACTAAGLAADAMH